MALVSWEESAADGLARMPEPARSRLRSILRSVASVERRSALPLEVARFETAYDGTPVWVVEVAGWRAFFVRWDGEVRVTSLTAPGEGP